MTQSETNAGASGSPFWRFSLRFYRMPGVADACIALQDEAGVDVNLLLFLLWNARMDRVLSRADVEGLESRVAEWRDRVVIPLRDVRRQLKSPPDLVDKSAAEALRTRIKHAELEAERLQQEGLFALAESSPPGRPAVSPEEAARDSVLAYQAMKGVTFPPAALGTVFSAFEELAARAD
jgi:uncharacterized protein (TIGR02444 family)